jgi:hypothetical protein
MSNVKVSPEIVAHINCLAAILTISGLVENLQMRSHEIPALRYHIKTCDRCYNLLIKQAVPEKLEELELLRPARN